MVFPRNEVRFVYTQTHVAELAHGTVCIGKTGETQ